MRPRIRIMEELLLSVCGDEVSPRSPALRRGDPTASADEVDEADPGRVHQHGHVAGRVAVLVEPMVELPDLQERRHVGQAGLHAAVRDESVECLALSGIREVGILYEPARLEALGRPSLPTPMRHRS